MLRNYLKIALRNLAKHKLFTGLNIFGLSISMSVCLVIILLVYDHFQYDTFHPKGDQIYRVITFNKGASGPFNEGYATSPLPFKNLLVEQFAAVDNGTNLNSFFRGEVRSPHKVLETRSLFADQEFFNVFGFELLEGNRKALQEPFHVVLSQEFAEKLFPNQAALGQTIDFEDHGSYKVSGVVKTPPGQTHMKFDALASLSTLPILKEKGVVNEGYETWENIWSNYNYLVLNEGTDVAAFEQTINEIAEANLALDQDHPGLIFELQPLRKIVPARILGNEISFALPWFFIAFFALLGLIVLITATINYTNLSIAKSLSRAKEIAIRKVNGASKRQVIFQFLVESIITALLSLLAAFPIYFVLVRAVNEMWIFSQIGIKLTDSLSAYGYFLLFALLLGLLTGLGPSVFLSKIKTISSLKGSLSGYSGKKSWIQLITGKRTLLSIQFSLSILMLVTILTLNKQANFLIDSKFGFDESHIFFINKYDHDEKLVGQTFSAIPGVKQVAFASHHPAVGESHGIGAKYKEEKEPVTLYHFGVDENYVEVMGLKLIAGSDFPRGASNSNEKFIILNETAISIYGFESSTQAIGEIIRLDTLSLTVRGVVKDYHWEPLMKSIRPLGLRIMPETYEYAYLKVDVSAPNNQKERYKEAWIEFDPSRDFEGGFLDEKVDEFYQFFYDLRGILLYIAAIALSITGLGFLGMVSFELKTKVKEIGIRKVLGASFRSLTLSMSKKFVMVILITLLLATPFAMWVNGLWVYQMAAHAELGISIFLPTILVVVIISGATILSQIWINSAKNPSETLRTE